MTRSGDSRRLPTTAKANLALLALLAGALVAHLWPEWTSDPDLSHGFLMPVACVLLVSIHRRGDGGGFLPAQASAALTLALGLLALGTLWGAGLMAVSLDWNSAIVDFALSSSLAFLGCAAVAAFSDRRSPWIPFAWGSLAAALLWPLSSPLPPGTYSRLTLDLQLWVSSGVMHTLGLLGVAARRQGNIIELATGTVGVEEACSGVRSLVSCVFAGLLFSATLVRRPWHRVLLVGLSAPLALAMNFLRSLALTLLVNAGVRIEGPVHNATGYAVLLVTAALLLALALYLEEPEAARGGPPAPAPGLRSPLPQRLLLAILALALATVGFFAANTAVPSKAAPPAPDLLSLMPSTAPGWDVRTTGDLYRFSGTLRTDHLAQRTYLGRDAQGPVQVTLYVAYWAPGEASVGLVGSHTPDACWPGAGWRAQPVDDPRVTLLLGGRRLPAGQHRLFMGGDYPQHVWFWQVYGGRPVDLGNTRSVRALLAIALRYGIRQGGEQAFVRVSANRPWDKLSAQPFLADFFRNLQPLGLYGRGDPLP